MFYNRLARRGLSVLLILLSVTLAACLSPVNPGQTGSPTNDASGSSTTNNPGQSTTQQGSSSTTNKKNSKKKEEAGSCRVAGERCYYKVADGEDVESAIAEQCGTAAFKCVDDPDTTGECTCVLKCAEVGQACSTNHENSDSFSCVNMTKAGEVHQCNADADEGSDDYCLDKDSQQPIGQCQFKCEQNKDCGNGAICKDQVCVPGECSGVTDVTSCGEGKRCVTSLDRDRKGNWGYACVEASGSKNIRERCSSDEECAGTLSCILGVCNQACESDAQCVNFPEYPNCYGGDGGFQRQDTGTHTGICVDFPTCDPSKGSQCRIGSEEGWCNAFTETSGECKPIGTAGELEKCDPTLSVYKSGSGVDPSLVCQQGYDCKKLSGDAYVCLKVCNPKAGDAACNPSKGSCDADAAKRGECVQVAEKSCYLSADSLPGSSSLLSAGVCVTSCDGKKVGEKAEQGQCLSVKNEDATSKACADDQNNEYYCTLVREAALDRTGKPVAIAMITAITPGTKELGQDCLVEPPAGMEASGCKAGLSCKVLDVLQKSGKCVQQCDLNTKGGCSDGYTCTEQGDLISDGVGECAKICETHEQCDQPNEQSCLGLYSDEAGNTKKFCTESGTIGEGESCVKYIYEKDGEKLARPLRQPNTCARGLVCRTALERVGTAAPADKVFKKAFAKYSSGGRVPQDKFPEFLEYVSQERRKVVEEYNKEATCEQACSPFTHEPVVCKNEDLSAYWSGEVSNVSMKCGVLPPTGGYVTPQWGACVSTIDVAISGDVISQADAELLAACQTPGLPCKDPGTFCIALSSTVNKCAKVCHLGLSKQGCGEGVRCVYPFNTVGVAPPGESFGICLTPGLMQQ